MTGPLTGLRFGALCSGYGGLELAVEALGGRVVWNCEIDKWPRKVLRARWPKIKTWGDLRGMDWSRVAPVDGLVTGFPCQPVSHAGRRKGVHDGRWLWDDIIRAVDDLGPSIVLLENVRGVLSANSGWALGQVLGSLADRGFDAEWMCLRASDVGACHRRERWFCVAAHADLARLERSEPTR